VALPRVGQQVVRFGDPAVEVGNDREGEIELIGVREPRVQRVAGERDDGKVGPIVPPGVADRGERGGAGRDERRGRETEDDRLVSVDEPEQLQLGRRPTGDRGR